jgi:Rhs element Vgr protein
MLATTSTRNVPTDASPDLVTFKIMVNGKDMAQKYKVVSISTHKEINRIGTATMVLVDGDVAKEKFELSDTDDLTPGKKIELHAGYHSKDKIIFKGVIVKHGIRIIPDEGTFLTITLKHEAFITTTHRQSAVFADKKDSEIIEDILQKAGVKKEVAASAVKHKQMIQYNCSDWDFINMRAEQNGMYVVTEDDKVVVKKPLLSAEPALTLHFGSSIIEFDGEIDGTDVYTAVKASSWNYADQKNESGDPNISGLTELGNLSSSSIAAELKNKENFHYHGGALKENELSGWANALEIKSKLSKIRGYARCIGFQKINPGDVLKLNKPGDRFSGKAFVWAVKHEIDHGLWETVLQFGYNPQPYSEYYSNINTAPAGGLLAGVQGLQIGVVSKLQDDPENEFRVLLKLPSASASEDAVWARVATLDAGKERGSFFRPEIGDEVVVGFLNADPRHAVILGCMHSSKNTSPIKPDDKNHEKGIFTREKMKMVFNDEKKSITIETPKGNKIIISEDKKGISVEDENKNKIILNDKGIEINSAKDLIIKADSGKISISAGKDIEIKSKGGKLNADGASGVKINSSAITEIKGSMVNIN